MIICLSLGPETKASSLGSNQAPDIRGFSYPVQSLINADREENDKPEKNSWIEKNRFIFFLARRLLFFFLAFHRPSVRCSILQVICSTSKQTFVTKAIDHPSLFSFTLAGVSRTRRFSDTPMSRVREFITS